MCLNWYMTEYNACFLVESCFQPVKYMSSIFPNLISEPGMDEGGIGVSVLSICGVQFLDWLGGDSQISGPEASR